MKNQLKINQRWRSNRGKMTSENRCENGTPKAHKMASKKDPERNPKSQKCVPEARPQQGS